MKLNVKAMGLAFGILWGASLIVMGILAMIVPDYAEPFVKTVGRLYIGYKATVPGIIIGGVWGFIDACIAGVVFAWLYNKFSR